MSSATGSSITQTQTNAQTNAMVSGDAVEANSPSPLWNDRTNCDPLSSSNQVELLVSSPSTATTAKRPMESRGNVSVSSSDSVASSGSSSSSNSSDDESVSAMNTTNKKSKISSVPEVSDDSSDDDDAIPAVVVSSDGPNRAFQHAQTGASSGGIAAYSHTSSHYQKKYEPPTSNNMSKVELSLWRKQQRQQRNRMSAAASRQKQKARITELEQQIAEYQRKYAAIQNEINRVQQKAVVPLISSSIGSTVEVLDNSSPINEVTSSTGTKTNDIINPTAHFVPTSPVSVSLSSPVPEVVTLSSSNTPFKMISRQALSQELSFTPSLFFRTL